MSHSHSTQHSTTQPNTHTQTQTATHTHSITRQQHDMASKNDTVALARSHAAECV